MVPLAELVAALVDGRPAAPAPAAAVRRHRLAPLAFRAGLAEFRGDFIASSIRAEQQRAIAAEAVAALGAAGVPVALLKGASYAGWLYDDPAERPMTDIDLLVPVDAVDTAMHALYRIGYWFAGKPAQRSPYHHAISLKHRNASIDLHRSPMQLGRAALDLDGVWRRATPAAWLPGALRLDPLDETLFHVANLARHELMVVLLSYVDAGRLLRRVEREPLRARAAEWQFGRVLDACLAVIEHVLGWRAEPGPWWLPSRADILLGDHPRRPVAIARKLLLVEGPRELAALVRAFAHDLRFSF